MSRTVWNLYRIDVESGTGVALIAPGGPLAPFLVSSIVGDRLPDIGDALNFKLDPFGNAYDIVPVLF